ncbi:elongation factor 1-gamma (EF-1-gamma), putative [Trypanosoma cruzi marinkellei]|uniref:Elongation factor 1-gamma (EF-1-gamma), putative n=1 Tax=Trypanosoma cruzi marinkellei TaxID=85056 RepID=K2MQA9_TRYCR|nr:elongation factor 1-gamma (EF-1-gamma), putative [Trypanosoma cruzi marinkellei]
MGACGTLFALCWRPADAAARCSPCVTVLPALGVILLSPEVLLCRVRALLGVSRRVTDGATMASSGDDSRCVLGTHPHTLSFASLCGSDCGTRAVHGSCRRCSGGGRGAEGEEEAEPARRAAAESVRAGRIGARARPHGHTLRCCAVLLLALRRRRPHDVLVPLQVREGQQDAVHDGQPDPRVAGAHGARAPVCVGRCAHDWGGEAARHCGAVGVWQWHAGDCEGRGGHGAVWLREEVEDVADPAGAHDGVRVLGGPDDPEACAGGARVEVSVACL